MLNINKIIKNKVKDILEYPKYQLAQNFLTS